MPEVRVNMSGDEAIQRMFVELPAKVQKDIVQAVVTRAGKMLADALKAESPKESGLLKAALGVSKIKVYGGRTIFAAVGVRRGFCRSIKRTPAGKLRFRSAAASGQNPAELWRNPARYLHLVTGGRKAVTVIHKKMLYDSFRGRFLGKSVPEAKPNPFVDRAFSSASAGVLAMIENETPDQIAAEAAKLGME